MTREDIEYIIEWFSHIEQLATDGKTANGFQMSTDRLLATIKVVAKDSREYVEKFCNESIPNDLEEAAIRAAQSDMQDRQIMEASNDDRMRYSRIFRRGFKAGTKWQKEQDDKELSEKIAFAYQLGLYEKERQMMKEGTK